MILELLLFCFIFFFPHEGGQMVELVPTGDVGSPSLGMLRTYLDTVLSG